MTALRAGLIYFAIVFAIGFVLGAVRTLSLEPLLGDLVAVLVELPFMLAAAWLTCGWVIRHLRLPHGLPARLIMGGTAFGLLILSEYGLARFMSGQGIAEFFANWGTTYAGVVGLVGQILFALFPLIRRNEPSI